MLLTVSEAASKLRVCDRTIREQIKAGSIEAFKVGNTYRIPEEAMFDALRVRRDRELKRDPMPRPKSRSRLRDRIQADQRRAA